MCHENLNNNMSCDKLHKKRKYAFLFIMQYTIQEQDGFALKQNHPLFYFTLFKRITSFQVSRISLIYPRASSKISLSFFIFACTSRR